MTLRQLWVRVRALPAGSPLHVVIEADKKDAETEEAASAVEAALSMFDREG